MQFQVNCKREGGKRWKRFQLTTNLSCTWSKMKLGSPHSRLAELTTLLLPRSFSSVASSSQIDPAHLGDRWPDFGVYKRTSRAGKKGESARTPESSSAEYPHPSQHDDCERERWSAAEEVGEWERKWGGEGLCAHWRVILLPVRAAVYLSIFSQCIPSRQKPQNRLITQLNDVYSRLPVCRLNFFHAYNSNTSGVFFFWICDSSRCKHLRDSLVSLLWHCSSRGRG